MAGATEMRWPSSNPSRSLPSSTISPHSSCPVMRGGVMRSFPCRQARRSVPHTEQARTLITAPSRRATGDRKSFTRRETPPSP